MTKVSIPLGRLERVNVRDVWVGEASAFTPWLAKAENLDLLSETVGIELELEAQEKDVGPFRADLLCKNTADNSWVLIENQLERTDHTHLGQLLTYAAGLQAVTIVWVAQRFTEEHRATLDWLNEITDERFNFFGLEVELWRIGISPVAPKFNVVCKPNDWSKTISDAAKGFENGELTETKQLQLEYWTELRKLLIDGGSFIKPQKPLPQHWYTFAVGRSYFHLSAVANTRDDWLAVMLVMTGPQAKPHFNMLKVERSAIESEIGAELLWEELPAKKESRVSLRLPVTDFTDRKLWPQQHQWIRQKLEAFHKAFSLRVKALDADSPAIAESELGT
jgi:hypothetical protein